MSTKPFENSAVNLATGSEMGLRMNTNQRDTHADGSLKARASQPGIDPCDIAVEAMPAFLLDDLDRDDRAWLADHTAECESCRDEERVFSGSLSILDLVETDINRVVPVFPGVRSDKPIARYGLVDSVLGLLLVAISDDGVCEIGFARTGEGEFLDELVQRGYQPVRDTAAIQPVVDRLEEYFTGQTRTFDLPVDLHGVTPFTRTVLEATAEIPFGSLLTYHDLAVRIGKPGASRAVGNALGRNPIPVIVPCHRVIRSDRTLGGYTGGLDIKQTLLQIEGALLAG